MPNYRDLQARAHRSVEPVNDRVRAHKRGLQIGLVAGGAVGMLLLPVAGLGGYGLRVATVVLIYIPLVVGQNLITGNAGQIFMGQAALYGIGAYATGILAVNLGWSTAWVLVVAISLGSLVGFLVSLPAIRIRGDYLFIVSIGLNLIFLDIVGQSVEVTGGYAGLPDVPFPSIGPVTVSSESGFFYVALAGAALSVGVALLILKSRLGKVIEASRDDGVAAAAIGIRITPIVSGVAALSGAMAGLAGCILAYYLGFVGPQDYSVNISLLVFEMVVIGGLGSVPGSVLGTIILIGLPEVFRPLQDYRIGLGGAVMLVMMIRRPQGILGRPSIWR